MRAGGRGSLLVALLLAVPTPGCEGCNRSDAVPDAARLASSVREPLPPPPELLERPAFKADQSPRGFGLPPGCKLLPPIQRTPLVAANESVFSAGRHGDDELALATLGSDGQVQRAGIVSARGDAPRALAWLPSTRTSFERAAGGWLTAFAWPPEGALRRIVVWSEAAGYRPLATADRAEVVDFDCHERSCFVLSTLARPALAPGASLFVFDSTQGTSTRRDVSVDSNEAWRPLSIVERDKDAATIALSTNDAVAIYRVRRDGSKRERLLDTPHGAFDVVRGKQPIVIVPDAPTDQSCSVDRFPIRVEGDASFSFTTQAVPVSLVARPLAKGALLAWVAPISCKLQERTLVYLLRLDERGQPQDVMAVADASGFALATSGSELRLWLRTRKELIGLHGRCE